MRQIHNAKTNILQAAGTLLKKEGIDDFNIRKIADIAGVSIGTVYNYYPSKSQLVFDVMENLLEGCVKALNDEPQSTQTIFDTFRSIYFSMFDYFNLFQKNLMRDLSVLASAESGSPAAVEKSHMNIFQDAFRHVFDVHSNEVDPELLKILGVEQTISFIIVHFNDMIRRNVKDYSGMDFILRKLLSK